jgi:alpha-glucosidase
MRRWLRGDEGLDGWRVDVANMTGRHRDQDHNHEVARAVRSAMTEVHPDSLLIAEHAHDYTSDALGDGWHGVMNYVGFTRPVWTWLRDKDYAPKFLGSPLMVPRLGGEAVMETMREFAALVPWRTVVHSFNLLGSHDTTRIRTLVGQDSRQVDVAAGLLLTMPGIPMVTYGDEVGMPGDFGEDGRRPMPWDAEAWDSRLHAVYRDLFAVRTSLDALRHGGLRWAHASDDALVFLRETAQQTVVVHAARTAHRPVLLPSRHLPGLVGARTAYGRPPERRGDAFSLGAEGPEVNIWVYPSPA